MANLNIAIRIGATDNASGPIGKIGAALRGLTSRTGVLGRGFSGLQGAMRGALVGAGTLAVGGATAVAGALGHAVQRAGEFEQAMANVGAVSLASADQLGILKAAALEAGSTTKFTATESANALTFLAQAGFSVEESVTALPSVLAAAAAGNMELATTADIVSNVLGGFRMEAEESGRVADVLALASANSNTNIEMLGETMKFAAPAAAGLGISLEETTAAAGFLADAGIQASLAGTHLRGIMGSLASPTKAAADALADLGVSVRDEQGNMRGLADIVGQMGDALETATPAQRDFALSAIFGREAAGSFSILLGRGADELGAYADELGGASEMFGGLGAAQQQAAQQLDTFQGRMTLLRSAIDGAMVTLGDKALPILSALADRAIPMVGAAVERVVPYVEQFATGFARFLETVDGGANPINLIATAIRGLFPAAVVMRVQNIVTAVRGFVAQAQTAVAPLTAFVEANTQLSDVLGAVGIVLASVVLPALAGLVATVAPVILVFGALVGAIALARTAWSENWGGIQEKTAAAIAFVRGAIQNGLAFIQEWWAAHGDTVMGRVASMWSFLTTAFFNGIETGKRLIQNGLAVIRGWWSQHGSQITNIMQQAWTAMKNIFQIALAILTGVVTSTAAAIVALWAVFGDTITTMAATAWDAIIDLFYTALDLLEGALTAFNALMVADWQTMWDALWDASEAMTSAVKTVIVAGLDLILGQFGTSVSDIVSTFTDVDWGAVGRSLIDRVAGGIGAAAGGLISAAVQAAKNAFNAAMGWLTGAGSGGASSGQRQVTPGGGGGRGAAGSGFGFGGAGLGGGGGLVPAVAGRAAGGDTYVINVDARGSSLSADQIKRAVEKALREAGRQADRRIRAGV